MSPAIELFMIGITASFGPCMVFCSPVMLPYILATGRSWKEGFIAILLFSFARLITCCFLGLLAGLFGKMLTDGLHRYGYLLYLIGGVFITGIGLLIIFRKEPYRLCQVLKKHTLESNIKGPILLGFIVGIAPCLPLVAALGYIALKTESLWQGAFYGFAFGMGEFISPLLLGGIAAGALSKALLKNYKIYNLLNQLCGIILFLIGVNIIVSNLLK